MDSSVFKRIAQETKSKKTVITLASNKWSNESQTINVEGVTVNNLIFVSPTTNSYTIYNDCEIICTEQGEGMLTFVCNETPSSNVDVNIIIID